MSHKNLIIFFVLALFFTGTVFAGFTLIRAGGEDPFVQPLSPEADVIQVRPREGAKVDFVFRSTGELKVEVKDEEKKKKRVRKPRFFTMSGNLMTIEFSDEWKDKVERVVVPEGVLLEVVSDEPVNITVNDRRGSRLTQGGRSVLIDTSELNNLSFDGGEIVADGWGEVPVFEDFFEGEEGGEEEGGEGTEGDPSSVYCGDGTQAVRNYCCVEKNNNEPGADCSAGGGWVFDNDFLECRYQCSPEAGTDCGVGAQAVRNLCCAQENQDSLHASCDGVWVYDNVDQDCEYQCYDNGEEGSTDEQENAEDVGHFCAAAGSAEEKDTCCNDSFKNPLSTGPRPGFPDCVGRWKYSSEEGCSFECANYSEQRQILREIRESLQ